MARKIPMYTKKKLNKYRAAKEEERQRERKQEEHIKNLSSKQTDEILKGCREW